MVFRVIRHCCGQLLELPFNKHAKISFYIYLLLFPKPIFLLLFRHETISTETWPTSTNIKPKKVFMITGMILAHNFLPIFRKVKRGERIIIFI
uniref:Uncharacterized protein n=1 Tax=Heterorhabditis bacteriophora TaxID=37862 RepID=A0A1I7WUR6_HETBA